MTQRVMIFDLPPLLRQIILDALAADSRAEVIEFGNDEGKEGIDLIAAIREHDPDVIVTSAADRGLEPPLEDYLSADTGRRVLTIERVGRSAYLFSTQPEPRSLGEMSTEALVKAVLDDFTEH